MKRVPVASPQELFNHIHQNSTAVCGDSFAFYDFKSYLERFFTGTIAGITKMHHFAFDGADPSKIAYVVFSETSKTAEHKKYLPKAGMTVEHLTHPAAFGLRPLEELCMPPAPLSHARQEAIDEVCDRYVGSVDKRRYLSCC